MSLPVIIVGGGIGGLTAALCLHQFGIPVRVFERVPELKPLGVGINLLPHAARVIHEMGLADELAATGGGGPPKAVLIVSSYLPELMGICDRIAVMCRGRLGPAHPVGTVNEHALMREATGQEE